MTCYQSANTKDKSEKINWHSDTLPGRKGERVEQRRGTSIMSISMGADEMEFRARRIYGKKTGDDGNKKKCYGQEFVAKLLAPGSVFVWRAHADHRWQHMPCFPPRAGAGRSRIAIVCRWLDSVRLYSTDGPYFNAATGWHGGDGWLREENKFECGCPKCVY